MHAPFSSRATYSSFRLRPFLGLWTWPEKVMKDGSSYTKLAPPRIVQPALDVEAAQRDTANDGHAGTRMPEFRIS